MGAGAGAAQSSGPKTRGPPSHGPCHRHSAETPLSRSGTLNNRQAVYFALSADAGTQDETPLGSQNGKITTTADLASPSSDRRKSRDLPHRSSVEAPGALGDRRKSRDVTNGVLAQMQLAIDGRIPRARAPAGRSKSMYHVKASALDSASNKSTAGALNTKNVASGEANPGLPQAANENLAKPARKSNAGALDKSVGSADVAANQADGKAEEPTKGKLSLGKELLRRLSSALSGKEDE